MRPSARALPPFGGPAECAAQRVRLSGRRPGQQRDDADSGGAVQEHAQGILCQQQQSDARQGRHGGCGSLAGPRHRHRDAHRTAGGASDEEGKPEGGRGAQESVPQGEGCGHGEVSRGQGARARDDDQVASDSQEPRSADEDRRRGISGGRQQGHLLLHRRSEGRLSSAHQGAGGGVSRAHRDEADRRAPGGRPHRRHGALRPRALLRHMEDIVRLRLDRCGAPAEHLAQSAEARRTVRQAQVLPQL